MKRKPKEYKEETNVGQEIIAPTISEEPDEQPEINSSFDTSITEDNENNNFEVTVPKDEESYIASSDEEIEDKTLEQENVPEENDPSFSVEVPVGEDENYDASAMLPLNATKKQLK